MTDSPRKITSLVICDGNLDVLDAEGRPLEVRELTFDPLELLVDGGDETGVVDCITFNSDEEVSSGRRGVRLRLSASAMAKAEQNGRAILELIRAAVADFEHAAGERERARAKRRLFRLHFVFRRVFRRSPDVHSLLTRLSGTDPATLRGILGGARNDRGRPPELARDLPLLRGVMLLKRDQGLSTTEAIARLQSNRPVPDLPGQRALQNRLSALRPILDLLGEQYFVSREHLVDRMWSVPGETRSWRLLRIDHA